MSNVPNLYKYSFTSNLARHEGTPYNHMNVLHNQKHFISSRLSIGKKGMIVNGIQGTAPPSSFYKMYTHEPEDIYYLQSYRIL